MNDDVFSLLEDKKCKCCRKPLKSNNTSGYCRRAVCMKHRYQNDQEYRERRLLKNSKWHKKKYQADPEWARKRQGAFSKRRRASCPTPT